MFFQTFVMAKASAMNGRFVYIISTPSDRTRITRGYNIISANISKTELVSCHDRVVVSSHGM
jgi:hypothetical protein